MIRLIKRYESRKLYDTEESRYVSMEEIAGWIREGQEVRVLENATSADVTAQTVTQIIVEQGRSGRGGLPTELLHELVRMGEKAWTTGIEQVQQGVDRLLQSSINRLGPVRKAREEMVRLREQLRELERSLAALETRAVEPEERPAKAVARPRRVAKSAAKPAAAAGPAAAKPARKPAAPRKRSRPKPSGGSESAS